MAFHRNALQIYQFEIGNLQSAIRNHESPRLRTQFSSSECGAGGGLNRSFEERSELIWKFVSRSSAATYFAPTTTKRRTTDALTGVRALVVRSCCRAACVG